MSKGSWESGAGAEGGVGSAHGSMKGADRFLASPHSPPSYLPLPSESLRSCRERLSEGTAALPMAL